MKKVKLKDIIFSLGFQHYRKVFFRELFGNLREERIFSNTVIVTVGIIAECTLTVVGFMCLAQNHLFTAVLALAAALIVAGFLLFGVLPKAKGRFQECLTAADEEAYKAQLKHEKQGD